MKKVALITGATRGIGRSTAMHLAEKGYVVVVNGTQQELVDEVVQHIRNQGHEALGYPADISDRESVREMVEFVIKEVQQIDVLIHNAGNTQDRKAINMTDEAWHSVMDVHVNGAFYCISRVLPYLLERGGDILLLTSTAGLTGSVGQWNYSTAKAAILGMLWTLSAELKSSNIRVNAIAPAALTDMTEPVINYIREKSEKRNEPFPEFWKVGSPEDIAYFIAALLEYDNRELTGEVFGVNGRTYTMWEKPSPVFSTDTVKHFFETYEDKQKVKKC